MLLVHLLRILTTLNKDLIHEVDRRWAKCLSYNDLKSEYSIEQV
jgi:hypothetical protein